MYLCVKSRESRAAGAEGGRAAESREELVFFPVVSLFGKVKGGRCKKIRKVGKIGKTLSRARIRERAAGGGGRAAEGRVELFQSSLFGKVKDERYWGKN